MKKFPVIILFFLFFMATGCIEKSEIPVNQLVAEAEAFMEAYAQDLRAKDATALADRYHKSGTYFLGNGHKLFAPYDSIRVRYMEKWRGPESFEWQDLSFEAISTDAIMVLGKFVWGRNDREPSTFSYAGLLKRQDGELRIRLEDESVDPMTMKDFICAPDSVSQ